LFAIVTQMQLNIFLSPDSFLRLLLMGDVLNLVKAVSVVDISVRSSVIVMIPNMSPSPVLSYVDDSVQEIILVESSAGMNAVTVSSRSPMCDFLVAMPKHQFHAGNSTRSKMFFAISKWRKICPRASILL
jgi:hypothetical protein